MVIRSSAGFSFQGRFVTSADGKFAVSFADGHGVKENGNERWVDGSLVLVQENHVIWIRNVARPFDASVANDGTVLVIDQGHKPPQILGGSLLVYSQSGEIILRRDHDSNLNDCAIAADGSFCFFNTLYPDNSLYCLQLSSSQIMWKLKDKDASMGLIRIDNEKRIIEIRDRQGVGIQRTLDFSGVPVSSEAEEALTTLRNIKSGLESTEAIARLLSSNNGASVLKTLETLKTLLSRKKFSLEAEQIIPILKSLSESTNQKVSQLVLDDLLLIHKRGLDPNNDIVKFLTKSLESKPLDNRTLFQFTKIASVDPSSLADSIPRILTALSSSPAWNDKRFAAFAVGEIGKRRPELVKDAVPYLVHYVLHPEETKENPIEAKVGKIELKFPVAAMLGVNPGQWLKDASIDALGMIGGADPGLVSDAIKLLERVSGEDSSEYSRKKAQRALKSIQDASQRGTG